MSSNSDEIELNVLFLQSIKYMVVSWVSYGLLVSYKILDAIKQCELIKTSIFNHFFCTPNIELKVTLHKQGKWFVIHHMNLYKS